MLTQRSTIAKERQGAVTGLPIEPDILVPSQFFAERHVRYRQPEQRLALAVLEDGVLALQKTAKLPDVRARIFFHEAYDWIFYDIGALFPFDYVCEVLNLDADHLREGLQKWLTQHHAGLVEAPTNYRSQLNRNIQRLTRPRGHKRRPSLMYAVGTRREGE